MVANSTWLTLSPSGVNGLIHFFKRGRGHGGIDKRFEHAPELLHVNASAGYFQLPIVDPPNKPVTFFEPQSFAEFGRDGYLPFSRQY